MSIEKLQRGQLKLLEVLDRQRESIEEFKKQKCDEINLRINDSHSFRSSIPKLSKSGNL